MMRWLGFFLFSTAAVLGGCNNQAEDQDPVLPPAPGDFCPLEHQAMSGGVELPVCEEPHAEAPFVHLPENSETRMIAGLQGDAFVTADGTSYPYAPDIAGDDPEEGRHALALYELELSGDSVTSFKPIVLFEDIQFLGPFMGQAFEGVIARRDGEGFAYEATLPVRVEIKNELVDGNRDFTARAVIANLHRSVTASDGSCMPALSSYGDESTFAEGANVELHASRAPWMHGFGDDMFVFEYFVDGVSQGSLMGEAWYRGPIDVVNGTLAPSGTYTGAGHGSPGSIPQLTLTPAAAGGEPCEP